MMSERPDTTALPSVLPIFPLAGVLELPLLEGYRRVVPEWREFAHDLESEDEPGFDRDRLLRGLRAYFQHHQISADWDAITAVPGERLVTSIAMICPFEPSEKQALLE